MVREIEIKKLKKNYVGIKIARSLIAIGYVITVMAIVKDDPKATVIALAPLTVGGLMLPVAHKLTNGRVGLITLSAMFSSISMAWCLGTEFARVLPYNQPLWLEAIGLGSMLAAVVTGVLGIIYACLMVFEPRNK